MTANVSKIFDTILLQAIRSGRAGKEIINSAQWFRNKAKELGGKGVSAAGLTKDVERKTSKTLIGNMYFYSYNPKHKKTLPYYDRYPLIFMVGPAKGGFYGINLHYLPLPARAKLMDSLFTILSNKKFDEQTKLKISYQLLKKSKKFKEFKPCFKHYLTSHIASNVVQIYSVEWNIAAWLPLAKFEKASQEKVWSDARKIIGKL